MITLQFNGLVAEMTRGTTQVMQPEPNGIHPGGPVAGFPGRLRPVARMREATAAVREETTNRGQSYLVGDLVVDTARRVVTRDGAEIRVGKLTYDLLTLLIEESPAVVSRNRIASRLWNQRYVSPETVRQRVKLLRKALHDDPAKPRYITVVRGQGYRLIPAVRRRDVSSSQWSGKRQIWIAAAAVLALIALTTVTGSETLSGNGRPGIGNPDNNSIAVLPFENISGDSSDSQFLTGLHNDLLTRLAQQQSLDVNSRASVLEYRQSNKRNRTIGRELGVATILEGSIQRSGEFIRINVQLIDANTEKHIWAEIYDRRVSLENHFALQNEIATTIVAALNNKQTFVRRDTARSLSKF